MKGSYTWQARSGVEKTEEWGRKSKESEQTAESGRNPAKTIQTTHPCTGSF